MSVVGIDFGTLNSKIGVARRKGIDIIANEVSNRQTPSLVSFLLKQRALGEPAKTAETSNYKNTVGSLKRLIGRTLNDTEIQEVESKYLNAKLADVQGTVGVQVNYLGEPATFSATQLVAMYLGKLRDTTANELNSVVSDVVLAVPVWYTEIQRRATIDAAKIAGLNVLRLINDTTATAFGYGITKMDLPEPHQPARHIAFVDVGHSTLSISIVAFSKGQLTVKATAFDRNLGGRDLDYALVQHFAAEFKEKYKIDVLSNPKATFRLAVGCEKLKKVLSANAEAPLNVESIMNDIDASSKLTREQFESLIASVLDRVTAPLEQALADSGLTADQIDAVELIGGSSRVPAIRTRISSVFGGKQLSSTLNQDEAVARGATFACATLSPVFRVREFSMVDLTPYAIKVQWEKEPDDEDTELVVFERGNAIPSTKILTFYRKGPFDIEAVYKDPSTLPGTINPWISRLTVKQAPPAKEDGEVPPVKVRIKLNLHGVVSFEQAYYEEVEEKEEKMEVDGEAPKKKRIVRKKDLPFVAGTTSSDPAIVEQLREAENQMHAADKLVTDTVDRKNALEEYIYDMRGKLDSRYAAYAQPQEKEALLKLLQESEDWLYSDEGDDATKSAYVERLDAAKKIGDPISARYLETENRSAAAAQLREALNLYGGQAASEDEKYAHIDAKDKQSIIEKVATVQKWLDDSIAKQSERQKNVDPVFTCAEVLKKRDEITYFALPILNKPKPKPKTEAPASGTETPKSGEEQKKPGEEPSGEAHADPEAKEGPSEMDVD